MMGFFKKKQVPAPARYPEHKVISFGGWRYAPTPDITTYELAVLAPVFGTSMHSRDIKPYLEQNNLTRHFHQQSE
jgi:hypothetical protein